MKRIALFLALVLALTVDATAATTFLEPGSDHTQNVTTFFPGGAGGVITSATDQSHTGPRSIRFDTGAGPTTAFITTAAGILSDAGSAVSIWCRFQVVTPTVAPRFIFIETSASAIIGGVGLDTSGHLQWIPAGATTVTGSTVLSTDRWYRISVSFTITNTTTFRFQVYLDGVPEINATAGTLTRTGASLLLLGENAGYGANKFLWMDDIYVDNRADYTDPGDIRVTAKRPNANGTTNGFTTQIGAGGSGYGTGHSPQVNEQPLSTTNGWSMVGAGAAVTEEYNIEDRSTGDVNLATVNIVDIAAWVFAKSLASETGQIILAGATSNIALTSTNTNFLKYAGSTTYPPGSGADVGIVTDTSLTTVSLYECGVLVAFKPIVNCRRSVTGVGC